MLLSVNCVIACFSAALSTFYFFLTLYSFLALPFPFTVHYEIRSQQHACILRHFQHCRHARKCRWTNLNTNESNECHRRRSLPCNNMKSERLCFCSSLNVSQCFWAKLVLRTSMNLQFEADVSLDVVAMVIPSPRVTLSMVAAFFLIIVKSLTINSTSSIVTLTTLIWRQQKV